MKNVMKKMGIYLLIILVVIQSSGCAATQSMGSGTPVHVTAQDGNNFYNTTMQTQINENSAVSTDIDKAKVAGYVALGILAAFALVFMISPGTFVSVDLQ